MEEGTVSLVLRTSRLVLRRPVPADVDAVWRIHRDPRAWAHNPGDAIETRGEAEERLAAWEAHWERYAFGYWAICWAGRVDGAQLQHADHDLADPQRGEALGFCGIKRMELHGRPVLNLFYRLDPAAWGDGIATEAATAVVQWADKNEMLIARVRPANAASITVAQRAGLRRAPDLDTVGEDGLDWIFARETATAKGA